MTARARAAALTLVIAAAGCAHAPPATRPYPAPGADALVGWLTTRQRTLRSMSARTRATSWLGSDRVRATVDMLIARDGHLRFEAEISLQGVVAALATDGVTFALYDARKNTVARGPACPANVASLIRIPLAPADVAAVLLGDAPPPRTASAPTVSWDAARGADVLAWRLDDGGALALSFRGAGATDARGAPDRALVAVLRTGRDGKVRWRTSYEDIETIDGVRVPGAIRFAEGDASFDDGVEIRFKDRALNAPTPDGSFTLTPPPGAAVSDVGCRVEGARGH